MMITSFIGFLSGFIFGALWERSTKKISHLCHQGGYHFHHSLFGIFVLFFIPFVVDINKILFIICFGLGVITQHTIQDGFVFITKDD